MRLLLDDISIAVTQMGRDFVLVDSPINLAPSEGIMVLQVDESESQWRVRLPNGISVASMRIDIVRAE